jgi:hypothetical protein
MELPGNNIITFLISIPQYLELFIQAANLLAKLLFLYGFALAIY